METIGDAYCAAGGLHRPSCTHAQQIAWMALCMLEVCQSHQTHDGQPIQVRPFQKFGMDRGVRNSMNLRTLNRILIHESMNLYQNP